MLTGKNRSPPLHCREADLCTFKFKTPLELKGNIRRTQLCSNLQFAEFFRNTALASKWQCTVWKDISMVCKVSPSFTEEHEGNTRSHLGWKLLDVNVLIILLLITKQKEKKKKKRKEERMGREGKKKGEEVSCINPPSEGSTRLDKQMR